MPANRDAPRYARERVAAFDALTPPVIIDAQLVISEMVTNAVVYADVPPDGTLDIELSIEDEHLVIELDDHHGSAARATYATPRRPTGVGLEILSLLCDQWDAYDGHVVARIAQ